MEHLGRGFVNMLMISMPVVLTAASIGLVVGILQAVTQIQEQTIAAAPKILGVSLAIIIMGGFFTKVLSEYLIESVNLGCNVVAKQGDFVLPATGFPGGKNDFFNDKKFYSSLQKSNIDNMIKNPGKVPYGDKKEGLSVTKTDKTPISRPNFVETKKLLGR
ncbi:MAG: Flagellar biosynthetic protein FliQ [uncultured bacterium]|nr:MAG: Flagellar biosynthetic protein FliQ [uncultured bacterium]